MGVEGAENAKRRGKPKPEPRREEVGKPKPEPWGLAEQLLELWLP